MWTRVLERSGLKVVVLSGLLDANYSLTDEVVGFFIRDQEVKDSIRAGDDRILEILNWAVDEIENISTAAWANDHLSFFH